MTQHDQDRGPDVGQEHRQPGDDRGHAWPAGARSVHVDLDGDVHLLDFGGPAGAPVVLLVHGLGGSALNWGLVGPQLAAHHRVLAVDLFGHGRSGLPRSGAGLVADGRLLEHLTTEVVGEPVVLVGHSMGAILAVRHAAAAPGTIRHLVLISPPVPGRGGRLDIGLAAKRAFLGLPGVARAVGRSLTRMTAEELVERQLRQATPHRDRVPAEAVHASTVETRARAARSDAARAQAQQWAGILETTELLSRPRAWRRVVADLPVRALWLQGADDLLVDAAAARALAAARPDWSFQLRPGVGHVPALEDPRWVTGCIEHWTATTPAATDRVVP